MICNLTLCIICSEPFYLPMLCNKICRHVATFFALFLCLFYIIVILVLEDSGLPARLKEHE